MKNNYILERKILLEIKGSYIDKYIHGIKVKGYDMVTISDKCKELYNRGLINYARPIRHNGEVVDFMVGELTSKGHDYLEKIMNETIIDKILKAFKNI